MPNSAHPSDGASSRESAAHSTRAGRKRDADTLARRLNEKLSGDAPVSLSAHQSAARTLAKLRERILDDGQALTPQGAQLLLGAGVMAHRRSTRSARIVTPAVLVEDANQQTQQEKDVRTQEDDSEAQLLAATSKLVFVLLCVLERRAWEDGDTDLAAVSDVAALDAADGATLDPLLLPRPNRRTRKRARGEDETRDESDEVVDAAGVERWRVVLAYVGARGVERSALRVGARSLAEKRSEAGRWRERMDALGPRFYRAAAERLAVGMLLPDGDRDFCTLDAASIARSDEERAEKLRNIVQAGESEAGQGVARALMLSLCLPASVVGVRRTLLLSRQAYATAGVDHPQVVERAHNVACAVAASNPGRRSRPTSPRSSSQDGRRRVDLGPRRGRRRAHGQPAHRARHDDHQGRRRPDPQGGRLRRAAADALFRGAAARRERGAAHLLRRRAPALGALPLGPKGHAHRAVVAARIRGPLQRGAPAGREPALR